MMTRDQPEFVDGAAAKIEIVRDTEEGRGVTVSGHWDEILQDKDCRTPLQAFIIFKPDGQDHWQEEELDVEKETFIKSLDLPEYCKDYHFRLRVVGYPGTEPITMDIDTQLSSNEVEISLRNSTFNC